MLISDIEQAHTFDNQWVSTGIHPWHISQENWQQQLAEVEKYASHTRVVAIGECGLDRLMGPPIEQQLPVFEAQLHLAERIQKPVIIHCVKAFNELISLQKKRKFSIPMVVHGFNNNPDLAQQLIAQGFYVSLGAALLRTDSNAQKTLNQTSLERLFLENDAQSTPIDSIYKAAASLLKIDIEILKTQIWRNFEELRGRN